MKEQDLSRAGTYGGRAVVVKYHCCGCCLRRARAKTRQDRGKAPFGASVVRWIQGVHRMAACHCGASSVLRQETVSCFCSLTLGISIPDYPTPVLAEWFGMAKLSNHWNTEGVWRHWVSVFTACQCFSGSGCRVVSKHTTPDASCQPQTVKA